MARSKSALGCPSCANHYKGQCTIYTADALSMGYRGAVEALHIDVDGLWVLTHMTLTRAAM